MTRIKLHRDIYSKEAIVKAISDYKGIAKIRLQEKDSRNKNRVFLTEDDEETLLQEEPDEEAGAPEIDVMAGMVGDEQEETPKKTARKTTAKKTTERRKTK